MSPRELWVQLRRLVLSAVAILDRYYGVGKKMPGMGADDFPERDDFTIQGF
jgi:hypothetical protein